MITIPLNPSGDVGSHLTATLHGRRIALGDGKADGVHPYTALAACWRRVSEPAEALLLAVEALRGETTADGPFDEGPACRALKSLIYGATETLDFYQQDLPNRLCSGRPKAEQKAIRDYQAAAKRIRDPIAKMCNLMKHDYREITAARIVSQVSGAAAFVYRINVAKDGVQQADRQVHGDGQFASFERTQHEVVHGLLRVDVKAGDLVSGLADNADDVITLKGPANLGLREVLVGLGTRPPLVAQSEPALFDGIEILGGDVVLTRVHPQKVAEPTVRTVKITVDEVAPSAQMFL